MKQFYFISGLPRSGSTLLSSILKQNPRFHAGISSSLLSLFRQMFETCNEITGPEFSTELTTRLLKSVVNCYYDNVQKDVIFDTNRLWTNLLPQLKSLYPYTKVIVCVRDITRILDSFERMHQINPMNISSVFPKTVDFNVYSRMSSLMSDGGIVKLPYECIKSSICGMYQPLMFICEYDILTKNPEGTMKAIYNFIEQPYFEHDFDNVENSYDEFDKVLNFPNLHKVYKKVVHQERPYLLPPDIINLYSNLEVWR